MQILLVSPDVTSTPPYNAISLHKVSVAYQRQAPLALRDINLSIPTGEVVGLLGPNGAGKSTLMRLLTGLVPATQGEVHVLGHNVATHAHDVRARVGYLPERVPLYEQMLVWDYLRYMARLRGVTKASLDARMQVVIDGTGLKEVLGKPVSQLSKGFRQRVGIAQAMVHNPDLLILDEPTTGLDPNQILELRSLIRTHGDGRTVLFSTHVMQEVTAVCDRVLFLFSSQLVAEFARADLERMASERACTLTDQLEHMFYTFTHQGVALASGEEE